MVMGLGLALAASSWPHLRYSYYVKCDPLSGPDTCTTITQQYRAGSEGGVMLGIVTFATGLVVLGIMLNQYVRRMFEAALKALRLGAA